MTTPEHPFAPYIRLLARGKTKSRDLTEEEAEAAWSMIMAGEVEMEQLGAFLMLMRLKEETPEEVAGFVRGARRHISVPADAPAVDLDWSSYAGKRKQLPWFLLSVMTLVQNGVRIFMHGTDGHTPGRLYTRQALETMGLAAAGSLPEASAQLAETGFAYLPLAELSPRLEDIINMKPVLGLRSPANTICRLLNPFGAPHLLQGIFHPSFMPIHQQGMRLLGEARAAVFRGEGGEIERRPNKALNVSTVIEGMIAEEQWPALLAEGQQLIDEDMAVERLMDIWRGDAEDGYATAAVTGTMALVLKLMGRAETTDAAQALAEQLWRGRDPSRLASAA